MSRLVRRLRSEGGATLVEYALLVSLIAVPALAGADAVLSAFHSEFSDIESELTSSQAVTPTLPPGTTTTTTTSVPTTTTTTTSPPATTTTTTTSPPATTTTTAAPSTTTTTYPPATTTTTIPDTPPDQYATVDTSGGTLEFALIDGDLSVADFDLNKHWMGDVIENPDGSLTVHLWHKSGNQEVWVHAYIDGDGNLIVTVS